MFEKGDFMKRYIGQTGVVGIYGKATYLTGARCEVVRVFEGRHDCRVRLLVGVSGDSGELLYMKGSEFTLDAGEFLPISKRFQDAVVIVDPGACNPSGVSRALVEAIDECRNEELNPEKCPACRLICHQLYNILSCNEYDYGSGTEYGKDLAACREKKAEYEKLTSEVV